MANNNKHTGPNVPALRFPEFSGEWEQHSLSDYLRFKNGLNPDAKRFGKGIKFISVMDILNNASISYDCVRASVAATEQEISGFEVEYGDVLFQRSSESLEDVGRSNIYVDSRHCVFGGFVIRGKKIGEYEPYFMKYRLDSPYARKSIIVKGAGAQHFNIGQDGLSKVELFFPKYEEQVKIGDLLRIIDDRINTQSKIIEELKTLRGALVDTYINDGNNNNESQTIISLGAYGCFVRGLTYSSVDVADNTATTGVVRSNNLEYGSPVDRKSGLVYVTKKPSPEQMLVNGDIVICMANGSSSLVGKASNYQELCRNMTVGAFCGIYRGTHPLTKWIFMTSAYCKAVANAIQGGNGAIANLHAEDILSMCFAVPSDYKTITELGKLLSLFDEKLHAAEEQLARFIEQKKHFLLKMFI